MSDQCSTPSLTPSRSPSPDPPVQPDHFFRIEDDTFSEASTPGSVGSSWLSPDDDPSATRGIPVFKPSLEEFGDFEGYMTKVECWGMKSGIVKIIPPKEWTDNLPPLRDQLSNVRVKSPIEQHMLGRSGLYRQQNIEKRKVMSFREWVELCAKDDLRAPGVTEVGLKAMGDIVGGRKRRSRRKDATAAVEGQDDSLVNFEVHNDILPEHDVEEEEHIHGEEEDHTMDEETGSQAPSAEDAVDNENSSQPHKRRRQTRVERDAALARRASLDEDFLKVFDPRSAWLPPKTKPEDYTPEFCAILERRYWRNCGLGRPPWYGADTAGSLFTDETKEWNVAHLDSALSRLLPSSKNGLPGVNTPYLYFGMWRATFAWHVEDMDLFSINYIHFGAPKFWYAIPQARSVQLENAMRSHFPQDVSQCRQFLRHKSFLASPTLLAQSSCKPNVLVQREGEFVITFPRGYHAGFNLGLNCAESVNFALESWLELGRKAEACGCIGDSVRIDVDQLLRDREEEQAIAKIYLKSKSKKRRSEDPSQKSSKSKKQRVSVEEDTVRTVPHPRITLKIQPRKDSESYPCCLCISRETSDLLRVIDKPQPWSGCPNLPPKDALGNEIWCAHESCALIVPETWVDEVEVEVNGQQEKEKVVYGVDGIVKDRWNLKCSACQKARSKTHGAPIQCTKGKCPKAFHISCAKSGEELRIHFAAVREIEKEVISNEPILDGDSDIQTFKVYAAEDATQQMFIDPSLTTPQDTKEINELLAQSNDGALPSNSTAQSQIEQSDEGIEPKVIKTIKKIEYELLCAQHNPVVTAARRANKLDRVRTVLLALPEMSRIKLRVSAGVFEVSLVRVIEERNTVEVIWDDGIKREFKWSSIVSGKTDAQVVGQKPTVAASPPDPHTPGHSVMKLHIPKLSTSSQACASNSVTQQSQSGHIIPPIAPEHHPTSVYTYQAFNLPPGQQSQVLYPGIYSYQYYNPGGQPPQAFPTQFNYQAMTMPPHMHPTNYTRQAPYRFYNYPPATSSRNSTHSYQTLSQPSSSRASATGTNAAIPKVPKPSNADTQVRRQAPISSTHESLPQKSSSNAGASSDPSEKSEDSTQPEVLQVVEELKNLCTLEPDQLQEVLNSRPNLREAVKALLLHQANLQALNNNSQTS